MKTLPLAIVSGLALASNALGHLKLPAMFGDHMVLQCESSAPVWGETSPGAEVVVRFGNIEKKTVADSDGKWSVKLGSLPASAVPSELAVNSGGKTQTIRDVLVGEVWLAGGQSNMRYPLQAAHNASEAIPQAKDKQLRFFNVPMVTAVEPQRTLKGKWEPSTPASARNFSAVAYFFAREIRRATGRPVAVFNAGWGGTPIQTWISLDGIRNDPPLTTLLESWDKALAQHRKVSADPQINAIYQKQLAKWRAEVEPAFNAATKAWNAEKAAGKDPGPKPVPSEPEPQNPDPMGVPSPSKRPQTPAVSFNGMIAPVAPYAMRGFLWYQGEANGGQGIEYRKLLPRLIRDWRSHWGADLPFLFVQLPNHGADAKPVAESGWPWLREAQLMTMSEPKTGMAVAIDIGDPRDVHPTGKLDVGRRLSLLARRDVYGEKITASGPIYQDFRIEGGSIRVRFRETGSGLGPGQSPWLARGVEQFPQDRLIGFHIAGQDRQWHEATARIDGDSVIVSSADVPSPVAVRYGWANSPRCNLYNKEGLPASPFRTDDWPK